MLSPMLVCLVLAGSIYMTAFIFCNCVDVYGNIVQAQQNEAQIYNSLQSQCLICGMSPLHAVIMLLFAFFDLTCIKR